MLFSKESLRAIAQTRGINELDEDALRILDQDLEYRLKEICQEASKFTLASHRTKLSIEDVNNTLINRNVEPLFGYDSQETLVFRGMPCNVYYVPDEEIDLEDYLEKPIPKIPIRPYIQSHWLAIEGVQPPIQQNPILVEKPVEKLDRLTMYQEELELKQQNKHLLTKELTVYFDKILQIMYTDPKVAMTCLENESGIQQLVPYFIFHFKMEMKKNIKDGETIKTILYLYYSLLKNKYIFVDPYLHEILPALLSCIMTPGIGSDAHELAGEFICATYKSYGDKYRSLAPKLVSLLQGIWMDENKTDDVRYGALYCLSIIPSNAVVEKVMGNIDGYTGDSERIRKLIKSIQAGTTAKQ